MANAYLFRGFQGVRTTKINENHVSHVWSHWNYLSMACWIVLFPSKDYPRIQMHMFHIALTYIFNKQPTKGCLPQCVNQNMTGGQCEGRCLYRDCWRLRVGWLNRLVGEPTHLKHMNVKVGSSSPQIGWKGKNVWNHWNHHLVSAKIRVKSSFHWKSYSWWLSHPIKKTVLVWNCIIFPGSLNQTMGTKRVQRQHKLDLCTQRHRPLWKLTSTPPKLMFCSGHFPFSGLNPANLHRHLSKASSTIFIGHS